MSDLLVRPLKVADQPEWRRLWSLYLEFYQTQVPESVFQTTFRRLMSRNPAEFDGLMATQCGRSVGIAHFLFHRHCWRLENVCYLQDLYVDAPARGKGVGRALIEGVYRAADAAGCPMVYWTTQRSNAPGRRLYDRVGELTGFIKYVRPL